MSCNVMLRKLKPASQTLLAEENHTNLVCEASPQQKSGKVDSKVWATTERLDTLPIERRGREDSSLSPKKSAPTEDTKEQEIVNS